ncbi:MAG: dynamin family protein [Deltaproteobacteria bacterium]|nr:dynamin family protein [Deltaproteobacteria bacterium]
MTLDETLAKLRTWYADHARPFLENESPDRLPVLDAAYDRLVTQAVPELPICFLGAAGTGKSTLLNAIAGGHLAIVPQGGVGPLTAQATLIRFGKERRFRATYLSAGRLNNLLAALEWSYIAEVKRNGGAGPDGDGDLPIEDRDELEDATPPILEAGDVSQHDVNLREKIEGYERQACLMILGTQYPTPQPDPRYLMEALRASLGQKPRWEVAVRDEDRERIERIKRALASDAAFERAAGGQLRDFLDDLHVHAAGHLAPLIRTLEVWWDSEVLRHGLVLVDLPGVGVANDEYRRVTAEWIRKARAVVLVVDRAGVTEASADLLRSTGFLNSLLHDGPDPDADAATLIVAAVRLDLVATDERVADRERRGDAAKRWNEHFEDVCGRMTEVIRGQVRQELDKLSSDGAESTRAAREGVVHRVLDSLQVFPMTPYEYRMFLRNDEDDHPKIRTAEESRVPQFVQWLASIGIARDSRLRARAVERYKDALARSRGLVDIVLEQWRAGERAAEEAARLRGELLVIAAPLEKQMYVRQGQFRELLRNGMPREIKLHTDNAANEARRDILKHLKKYEHYPWATLRAAVRKGGAFVGARKIDLPNELTLRFEDPIAVVWSERILAELRRATRQIAEDYADLVGQIVNWARAQGGRVRPAVVEALHNELKAQSREVAEVGKEAIAELKERVKSEIYEYVESEVRKGCQSFVRRKSDVGRGVRDRMLDFLRDDLADAIVDAARPAAQKVLETNFKRVEKEISEALARVQNPIQQAVDSIVSEHETHVRRSDAQRRVQVLAKGNAVLESAPPEHPEA